MQPDTGVTFNDVVGVDGAKLVRPPATAPVPHRAPRLATAPSWSPRAPAGCGRRPAAGPRTDSEGLSEACCRRRQRPPPVPRSRTTTCPGANKMRRTRANDASASQSCEGGAGAGQELEEVVQSLKESDRFMRDERHIL